MSKTKKVISGVIAVIIIVLIVWFAVFRSPQFQVAQNGTNNKVIYVCPSGNNVTAIFNSGGYITITAKTRSGLKLKQTKSADGGRYADSTGSFILWDKGTYAMITHRGITETCINQDDLPKVEADKQAIKKVVKAFGSSLQKVSLLAPNASETIAGVYAPYITPQLLSKWKQDLSSAPGRTTSSPWPDHFMINHIRPMGVVYSVDATLVLMTSNEVEHGGNAGTKHIEMIVVKRQGGWKINSYKVVTASQKQ